MKHKVGPTALFVTLVAALICVTSVFQTWAQTDDRKPQTFGSSLKRPRVNTTGQLNKENETKTKESESPEEIIRVNTSLVLLDVLVTDASGARNITALTKDDFIITEDNQPQEISTVTLGDDSAHLPRSIMLIFDRSDSQLAYIEASVEAAKTLVNKLASTDEMAIVTDDIQLTIGFTKDRRSSSRRLTLSRRGHWRAITPAACSSARCWQLSGN